MRSLVPADSLVYLETNDLAATLQPIVDSKPFNEVAKKKPDLSALKGVQLAVAITGFETSEEKINDEQSVGKIQPHFVAIADTHAWQFQTVRFAEQKLGAFVADIYDSEPTLEEHEKGGGHYLTWTAKDGRKAFAFVNRNLIYFGNDESSIDKCLAVARGETDSIAKSGKVAASDPTVLASGYVSTDGVAEIANVFALKFAQDASEEPEVQSAIAGILPQILRNTITDVTWTATKTDQGYADKWQIGMPAEVAGLFTESFAVQDQSTQATSLNTTLLAQLPKDVQAATRYNLKNPQLAWRSVLAACQKNLTPTETKMGSEFVSALFEPYGIRDADMFLDSSGSKPSVSRNIVTAKLDPESEQSVVIAARGNDEETRKALSPELKPPKTTVEGGLNVWSTQNGDVQIAFDQDMIKIGSKDNLSKINGSRSGELVDLKADWAGQLAVSTAPIATGGVDSSLTREIVEMLTGEDPGEARSNSNYFTETRFSKAVMERKTTSDFGFIGWVIAQLADE